MSGVHVKNAVNRLINYIYRRYLIVTFITPIDTAASGHIAIEYDTVNFN